MDIKQLRYYAAIVEEGTISAAARKLHITQPPLSYQIGLLESEYGVQLFERGARSITLTEAGNRLYQYALQILDLVQAAEDDMVSLHQGKSGSIRIGLISSSDSNVLYDGFRAFHGSHPDVQFKITEGNTYELLELLRKDKIELAFIRTPFSAKDMEFVPLTNDSMAAVGSPQFMQSLPDEIRVQDLGKKPLILYRRWEKIIRKAFEDAHVRPDVFCVNDDARTSLEWAAAGLGIALVPSSILHLMPHLDHRILRDESLQSSICIIKRKDHLLPMAANALYESFQKE